MWYIMMGFVQIGSSASRFNFFFFFFSTFPIAILSMCSFKIFWLRALGIYRESVHECVLQNEDSHRYRRAKKWAARKTNIVKYLYQDHHDICVVFSDFPLYISHCEMQIW